MIFTAGSLSGLRYAILNQPFFDKQYDTALQHDEQSRKQQLKHLEPEHSSNQTIANNQNANATATFVFVSPPYLYQNTLFHSFYAFVTDYVMFGDEIHIMICLA